MMRYLAGLAAIIFFATMLYNSWQLFYVPTALGFGKHLLIAILTYLCAVICTAEALFAPSK